MKYDNLMDLEFKINQQIHEAITLLKNGLSKDQTLSKEQESRIKFFNIFLALFNQNILENQSYINIVEDLAFLTTRDQSLQLFINRERFLSTTFKQLILNKDYKAAVFLSTTIEKYLQGRYEDQDFKNHPEDTNSDKLIKQIETTSGTLFSLAIVLAAIHQSQVMQFNCFEIGRHLAVICKLSEDLNQFNNDGGTNYKNKIIDNVSVHFDRPDFSPFNEEELQKTKIIIKQTIEERFSKIKNILYNWRYKKINHEIVVLLKKEIKILINNIK
jgi:hypothetical protein